MQFLGPFYVIFLFTLLKIFDKIIISMKKIFIILVSLLILANVGVYIFFNQKNQAVKETGLVSGVETENINGVDHIVETYYGAVGLLSTEAMLKALNVIWQEEDHIIAFPDPNLGMGAKIIIKKATKITINDANKISVYYTWQPTIKKLLEEKNINLGSNDQINQDLNTNLTSGMEIQITRVDVTEIKEKEIIEYNTITKNDPDLEKGKTRIESIGSNGLIEKTYRITRKDGVEISKELIDTQIINEKQDKITYIGTKPVVYGTGLATWYDLIGGMTAASNTLPYGTKVLVVNIANGKSVEVTIVDHGIQGSAIIDLSDEAFSKIGSLGQGVINVRIEKP